MRSGRGARGARAARRGRGRSPRARRSPTSTGRRCCSGSASAATSSRASRPRSRCFNEALELAERSGLPCDLLRARHPRLAFPLLPPPARLEAPARTSSARSSSPSPADDGAPLGQALLPGLARRRARRALGARPDVRGAGARLLRGARRPRERRPAAEQPRRPELHCSATRSGRSSCSRTRSRSRSRSRRRARGRARHVLAGTGPSRHLGSRVWPRPRRRQALELFGDRPDYLQGDRHRAARAGPRAARAGSLERG